MTKVLFGKTVDGQDVYKYTLKNSKGAYVEVLNYGAAIVSIVVPNKDNNMIDVVLGYDEVAPYETNGNFFGAAVGRNCNRTENAQIDIDGIIYKIQDNENGNNLHSGPSTYARRVWNVEQASDDQIVLSLVSPDGDGGFPGELHMKLTYTWSEDCELKMHYEGTCDKDTIINMTNHSYFNLSGHNSGTAMNHVLQILADQFTPVKDSKSITTGELWDVAGTPMDFTTEKVIGLEINSDYEQLIFTKGYDHNYVLNNQNEGVRYIAKAVSPVSGIEMKVYTDTPGVQFYAGNYISGPAGKGGAVYDERDGFCLETQYYPNCANYKHFPSPIVRKGDTYDSTTVYVFSK